MEKIVFENSPSTNTPINAANLNQIQTNAENAINEVADKNILTASISSNISFEQSAWTDLVFDTVTQIGDKLTYEDGKITIGSGITTIKLSATCGIRRYTEVSNGIKIQKNSEDVAINFTTNNGGNDNQATICITPIIINVTEGDVINFQAINNMTLYATRCFFTVEVVE